MESAHRYRLLIYFAALVLCLSVCFANAEQVSSPLAIKKAESGRIQFQSSQMHATFMPVMQQSYIHQVVIKDVAPVVSERMLAQVTADSQKSHHFWHGSAFAKKRTGLVVVHAQGSSNSALAQAAQDQSVAAADAGQSE